MDGRGGAVCPASEGKAGTVLPAIQKKSFPPYPSRLRTFPGKLPAFHSGSHPRPRRRDLPRLPSRALPANYPYPGFLRISRTCPHASQRFRKSVPADGGLVFHCQPAAITLRALRHTRNQADRRLAGLFRRFAKGVCAHPDFGADSPFYRYLGFIPHSGSRTGRPRKRKI